MPEGAHHKVALALEKPLAPATTCPPEALHEGNDHKLEVSVVFTSIEPTLRALKEAGGLADRLAAGIALVVPQIVPYPLPLTSPPVLLDFTERRFFVMARESHVETRVRIYLCRDRWDALRLALKPHSLVLIGSRKRWWPTAETRLAEKLRRAGHEVVVVETE
jgi:hypothetical protein